MTQPPPPPQQFRSVQMMNAGGFVCWPMIKDAVTDEVIWNPRPSGSMWRLELGETKKVDLNSPDHTEFHTGKLYKIGANVQSGSDLWHPTSFQYEITSNVTIAFTTSGAIGTSANIGYNGPKE